MLELITCNFPKHIEEVRLLFREYTLGLGIDLCFQNFEQELRDLLGDYQEPGGTLLVAKYDSKAAGCCALRSLKAIKHNNAAEMKRLYVRTTFRGKGIARQLVMKILRKAKGMGYSSVVLDTLKSMENAQALYKGLGFVEIPPYYKNPIAGAKYLKVDLVSVD